MKFTLEHTLYSNINKNVTFNTFIIIPIIICYVQVLNHEPNSISSLIINISYIIITIFILKWLIKNKEKFLNNLNEIIKFNQMLFFRRIKNDILKKDLIYNSSEKNLFFEEIKNRNFLEAIIGELDINTFRNEIKNVHKSIWIRNIFSYKVSFQRAIKILDEKLKEHNCIVDDEIMKKIKFLLVNNLNFSNTGVKFNPESLKKEMDNEIKNLPPEKTCIQVLDSKQRELLYLLKPFFIGKNITEKLSFLINSKIEKLEEEDLFFYSTISADAGRILMLLHKKNIISEIEIDTIYIQGFLSFKKMNKKEKILYSDADMLKSHKNSFLKTLKPQMSRNPIITKCLNDINQLYRS